MKKSFLPYQRKDLLSLGSDSTPLLNTLGDRLYYISWFLTFISYRYISKQFLLYRTKISLNWSLRCFFCQLDPFFIHRLKDLGIPITSYFDFYEVSFFFFATADKNRCFGRYLWYVESLFSSIYSRIFFLFLSFFFLSIVEIVARNDRSRPYY